ncbi:hypothetical protein GGP85_002908 [Salinibacter ruber]|uniref:hypothetical protein n=1 Tax=Salinibacter ruber TaxID=146919 RepID=UPI002167FDC9|nr:hypothetical protein [Salinibacter ruber]MCS3827438.1 hypothetical protein [Salinibacter ruber]
MDYEDLDDASFYSAEQTTWRYCSITRREYAMTWRHMPSWFLVGHFEVYVN